MKENTMRLRSEEVNLNTDLLFEWVVDHYDNMIESVGQCRKSGKTQVKVAEETGIHRSKIARVMSGHGGTRLESFYLIYLSFCPDEEIESMFEKCEKVFGDLTVMRKCAYYRHIAKILKYYRISWSLLQRYSCIKKGTFLHFQDKFLKELSLYNCLKLDSTLQRLVEMKRKIPKSDWGFYGT